MVSLRARQGQETEKVCECPIPPDAHFIPIIQFVSHNDSVLELSQDKNSNIFKTISCATYEA